MGRQLTLSDLNGSWPFWGYARVDNYYDAIPAVGLYGQQKGYVLFENYRQLRGTNFSFNIDDFDFQSSDDLDSLVALINFVRFSQLTKRNYAVQYTASVDKWEWKSGQSVMLAILNHAYYDHSLDHHTKIMTSKWGGHCYEFYAHPSLRLTRSDGFLSNLTPLQSNGEEPFVRWYQSSSVPVTHHNSSLSCYRNMPSFVAKMDPHSDITKIINIDDETGSATTERIARAENLRELDIDETVGYDTGDVLIDQDGEVWCCQNGLWFNRTEVLDYGVSPNNIYRGILTSGLTSGIYPSVPVKVLPFQDFSVRVYVERSCVPKEIMYAKAGWWARCNALRASIEMTYRNRVSNLTTIMYGAQNDYKVDCFKIEDGMFVFRDGNHAAKFTAALVQKNDAMLSEMLNLMCQMYSELMSMVEQQAVDLLNVNEASSARGISNTESIARYMKDLTDRMNSVISESLNAISLAQDSIASANEEIKNNSASALTLLNESQQRIQAIEVLNNNLLDTVERFDLNISTSFNDINEQLQNFQAISSDLSGISNQITAIANSLGSNVQTLNSINENISQNNTRMQNITNSIQTVQGSMTETLSSLNEITQKNAAISTQLSTVDRTTTQVHEKTGVIDEKIDEALLKIDDDSSLEEAVRILNGNNVSIMQAIAALDVEIDSIGSAVENAQVQNTDIGSKLDEIYEDLQQEHQTIEQNQALLKEGIANLSTQNSLLGQNIVSIGEQNVLLQESCTTIQETAAMLGQEHEVLAEGQRMIGQSQELLMQAQQQLDQNDRTLNDNIRNNLEAIGIAASNFNHVFDNQRELGRGISELSEQHSTINENLLLIDEEIDSMGTAMTQGHNHLAQMVVDAASYILRNQELLSEQNIKLGDIGAISAHMDAEIAKITDEKITFGIVNASEMANKIALFLTSAFGNVTLPTLLNAVNSQKNKIDELTTEVSKIKYALQELSNVESSNNVAIEEDKSKDVTLGKLLDPKNLSKLLL